MGGKRSDQYAIDPGEAGATDYKSRDDDEHIHEKDKQHLKAHEKKNSHIPETVENPAKRALKAARSKKR